MSMLPFASLYRQLRSENDKVSFLRILNDFLHDVRQVEWNNSTVDHFGGSINACEELSSIVSSGVAPEITADLRNDLIPLRSQVSECLLCLTEGKQDIVDKLVQQGVLNDLLDRLPTENDVKVEISLVMSVVHMMRWKKEYRDMCVEKDLHGFLKRSIQNHMAQGDNTRESVHLLNAMLDTTGIVIALGPFAERDEFITGTLPPIKHCLLQTSTVFTSCFAIRHVGKSIGVTSLINAGITRAIDDLISHADFFVAFDALHTVEVLAEAATADEIVLMFGNIEKMTSLLSRFFTQHQRFETKKVVSIFAKVMQKSDRYRAYELISHDAIFKMLNLGGNCIRQELSTLLVAASTKLPEYQFCYFLATFLDHNKLKNFKNIHILIAAITDVYRSASENAAALIKMGRILGIPKRLLNIYEESAPSTLNSIHAEYLLDKYFMLQLKRVQSLM